jgi:hypothetical protein
MLVLRALRDDAVDPVSVTVTTFRPCFARWSASQGVLSGLFVDANDLPVSLAAELDLAGPSVETLDAYRR